MKLNLFTLGETNEDLKKCLPDFIDYWSRMVDQAAPIFQLEGSLLVNIARDVPSHQAKYADLAQQARALMKWLEILKAKKEAVYLKNYHNSSRALGVKEQMTYLQGEKEIVELNQLMAEVNYRQQQFEEITEAIKQIGWMLTNIVKDKVAELQDIVL